MNAVHWTYKPEATTYLEQGDLLKKTEYILDVLRKYHPYYAQHQDNHFFAVLTQSCDLVVRDGACKNEYVVLAPVRPLRVVIEREFGSVIFNRKEGAKQFASVGTKGRYEDFLNKIFNNNHSKYFFLEKQPQSGLPEDMCIILPLAISIKAEHYAECLKARFLQLTDSFQAKLGYLIGQQYSKVGTQDWDETDIKKKVSAVVEGLVVWVPDSDVPALQNGIAEYETANTGQVVDANELTKMLNGLPKKKDQMILAIIEVAIAQKLLPDGASTERRSFRQKLENDAAFSKFFRT